MSQGLPEAQKMGRNEEERILAGMNKNKKEKHTAGSSHGLWQPLPHVEIKKTKLKAAWGKKVQQWIISSLLAELLIPLMG